MLVQENSFKKTSKFLFALVSLFLKIYKQIVIWGWADLPTTEGESSQ